MRGCFRDRSDFIFVRLRLFIYSGQGYFGNPVGGGGLRRPAAHAWKNENGNLVLTRSRSDVVVQSSRFVVFVGNRESLKNKRKNWIFMFLGSKKRKTNENNWRNQPNVGLWSSRWYQKDPQDRRGHFRKIWAWKTLKKQGNIKQFSGLFPIFPVDLA